MCAAETTGHFVKGFTRRLLDQFRDFTHVGVLLGKDDGADDYCNRAY